MELSEEEYNEATLEHYGIKRKSGRYPWGSGGSETTRSQTFLDMVENLRKNEGMTETQIAKSFNMTTSELRSTRTIALAAQRQGRISQAQRLADKGMSNVAIGERMGLPESTVRNLLAPGRKEKVDILQTTANMLEDAVARDKYIDVGAGVEHHIGVNATKLKAAVALLEAQGYKKYYVKVEQLGTGQQTTIKILAAPGTEYKEVYANRANIKQVTQFSEDGGRSFLGLKPPIAVDPRRVGVRYAKDGGTDADGVIYVRPGVADLSLGKANYAQVRIKVGDSHYLKGMAMYRDDLPAGTDLLFNTNKDSTGNKLDAMKKLKDDPDNPFGAVVRQLIDPKSGRNTSAMNIVNEEGDWEDWSKNLPSQMLSKQKKELAQSQLKMTYEAKRKEFEEIMSLTNPTVRRRLLESFADDADASAVHLKAAALPRQASHVILPVNTLKATEIYAPNYNNGERVALVRFPHGGKFEIPELTVNNRHPDAKRLLGNARDAVGIHSKVAERLSGADFDGDTVLVIPNNDRKVRSEPALEGLKGFDPQSAYKGYDGMRVMTARDKAFEMGDVSNLITDMTIKGATPDELARAVRHSMVVIDAEKHKLNYRQSAIDNGILALKAKYQQKENGRPGGASTLISRAGSSIRLPERKARSAGAGGSVDKTTGKKVYEETGTTYLDKDGKTVVRKFESKKLAETDDAHTLSSGTPIEKIYADHSNSLKSLALEARKAAVNTKAIPYSPSAKTAYSKEVASLDAKLALAQRNAPLERQAQVLANAVYAQKKAANPDMEKQELKRLKSQALTEMRIRTGARKNRIEITEAEWEAIQAGAISTNKLDQILSNADLDKVKEIATPRTKQVVTPAKLSRARIMLESGYTQAEVANALGVALSTLKASLTA